MAQVWRGYVTFKGVSPIDVVSALLVGLLFWFQPTPFLIPFTQLPIERQGLGWFANLLIGLAYAVPMAFRRTHPVPSALTILCGAGVHLLLEPANITLADFAVVAAVYAVTVYGPVWAHRLVLSLTLLGSFFIAIPTLTMGGAIRNDWGTWGPFLGIVTYIMAVTLAVYGLALARRSQLAKMLSLMRIASDAQAAAKTERELAVLEERSRIAREMHDIVAHTLSVVIAQADGGRYAATKDPEASTRALATISDMARDALKDIRSIIGVLRESEGDEQPTLPQPIERDLETLVRNVRDSGVRVSFVRTGQSRTLPVGVGNAVYRICQEAITNSLKHAGPTPHITVLLQTTDAALLLQVDDDGRGAAAPSDGKGHGLIGMSERASAFGGSVTSGPRPGGGFRVLASIPIPHLDNSNRSEHD